MSSLDQNRVIVLAVLEMGLSPSEAARRFNVSRQWVHVLIDRYREFGGAGLEPISRRPSRHPGATSEDVRTRITALRVELDAARLDARAESISDRLRREGVSPPAVSTIWRILRSAAMVVPQPQKRPRSSWHSFEVAQPNQTWQSDFTHWTLVGGTDIEVISWLDGCSRYLLHISAHPRVTGSTVTTTFTSTAQAHGYPASTLTDNGMVYTTRFANGKGGPNAFEYLVKTLGIIQKNGSPYHPQTQGKIERFHQTLKKWLAFQPLAGSCHELDEQLARFQHIYNQDRPHRAVGRADKEKHVIVLIAGPEVMIADTITGELLAEHTIDRNKSYQPKKQKPSPEGESFCQRCRDKSHRAQGGIRTDL